jgi:uncharacterized protein YecA (UPF0149 family)
MVLFQIFILINSIIESAAKSTVLLQTFGLNSSIKETWDTTTFFLFQFFWQIDREIKFRRDKLKENIQSLLSLTKEAFTLVDLVEVFQTPDRTEEQATELALDALIAAINAVVAVALALFHDTQTMTAEAEARMHRTPKERP